MTELGSVPRSIGIIMDGNRRWAKARGLPALEGHTAGYERLKEVAKWARNRGVEALVVYAFSTENWKRSEEEVGALMRLLRRAVDEMGEKLAEENARLIVLGDRSRLDPELVAAITRAEARSNGGEFTIGVAVSYGGRAEILDAIRRIPEEERDTLTEEAFGRYLWSADVPDPDLVIRTGGEHRLSNFLPWQSVYSELYFDDVLWPDFSEADLDRILAWYAARERRFGA
jgi:undecaprenyl diphosphate synthase